MSRKPDRQSLPGVKGGGLDQRQVLWPLRNGKVSYLEGGGRGSDGFSDTASDLHCH